jgi:hypothetical protein
MTMATPNVTSFVFLISTTALLMLVGVGSPIRTLATEEPAERAFLPDFSQGLTGQLGPFWWGRSLDLGEDLFFCRRNWPTSCGRGVSVVPPI